MLFEEKYSACDKYQSVVKSSEKGKTHYLENKSGFPVYQFHIDGGVIQDKDSRKCDFIVEAEMNRLVAYLIELKGSHIPEAIEQIESTVSIFRDKLRGYDIKPRIVIKRVNTCYINDSKYRNFKKKYPSVIVKAVTHTDVI